MGIQASVVAHVRAEPRRRRQRLGRVLHEGVLRTRTEAW